MYHSLSLHERRCRKGVMSPMSMISLCVWGGRQGGWRGTVRDTVTPTSLTDYGFAYFGNHQHVLIKCLNCVQQNFNCVLGYLR